jgi:hypothetical protein
MHLCRPSFGLLAVLVTLAACASSPQPSSSTRRVAEPRVVCESLDSVECNAAVMVARPSATGHAIDLVVAQGYYDCPVWAMCLMQPTPPDGWPLSAMVAMRLVGAGPVMVSVSDVTAASPVVVPMGNDPAFVLGRYERASPSPAPS